MNMYAMFQSTQKELNVGELQEISTTHPQAKYKVKTHRMSKRRIEKLKGPDGPKFAVMVTGAAGFIGMHTSIELKKMGMNPIGYDNVNKYYSIELKESRIEELKKMNIPFVRGDVCDVAKLKETIQEHKITRFIHLAAQAGVRYSIQNPKLYIDVNLKGSIHLFEECS